MFESFFQKKIEADPTKFSFREEALNLKPKGKETRFPIDEFGKGKDIPTHIDKKTGERFAKIDRNEGARQKLVALLLKGVINVSDVVKVKDDYFSHMQNFEKIEPGNEDTVAETRADLFIINHIFGDVDHRYYDVNSPIKTRVELEHPNPVLEHHNLLVDEKNKKSNFFDFGRTNLMYYTKNIEDPLIWEGFLKRLLSEEEFTPTPNTDLILLLLRKKVELLLNLHSNFDGFQKVVEKSGVKLDEEEQKTLFANLRTRLEALNKDLLELDSKK